MCPVCDYGYTEYVAGILVAVSAYFLFKELDLLIDKIIAKRKAKRNKI